MLRSNQLSEIGVNCRVGVYIPSAIKIVSKISSEILILLNRVMSSPTYTYFLYFSTKRINYPVHTQIAKINEESSISAILNIVSGLMVGLLPVGQFGS